MQTNICADVITGKIQNSNARGTTVRYHGCVVNVVLQPDIQHGKYVKTSLPGEWPIQSNIDQWLQFSKTAL